MSNNPLLRRQLKKITGPDGIIDQQKLLEAVSLTYDEYERSLKLQSHSTQLMSDELNELNSTIRKESSEAIAQSQKRFELAVEGSNDGIWDWNVTDDKIWMSKRCRSMLGYSDEGKKEFSIADWFEMVAPQDRERARSLMDEHLNWRMRGSTTLKFQHASGEIRHIMFRAATMQDVYGKVVRIVGIHTDISDIMVMQERLKRAKDAAEAANKAKSEFLANMSHELRTPMHAILGFARLSLKRVDKDKDEKLATMLGKIHISGERLLNLLNELLDLSKLESGKTSFDFRETDILPGLEQTINELDPLLLAKQITVKVQNRCDTSVVVHDSKFMMQVFINIISNAIKFSPTNSAISVTLKDSMLDDNIPALQCDISDKGIGIPENELETIFDKFSQSSKTASGGGGTGLGLSIVREILAAHGGKIWAENIPNGGAIFSFLLPRTRKAYYNANDVT